MKRIIAAAVGISMLLGTTAFADSITLSLGDNISQTITQQEQQKNSLKQYRVLKSQEKHQLLNLQQMLHLGIRK